MVWENFETGVWFLTAYEEQEDEEFGTQSTTLLRYLSHCADAALR